MQHNIPLASQPGHANHNPLGLQMTQIVLTHITVGNAEYTPTTDELQQVLRDFHSVKPLVLPQGPTLKEYKVETHNQQVVVFAGDAEWRPSVGDMAYLRDQVYALLQAKGGTLVTRPSVKLMVVLSPTVEMVEVAPLDLGVGDA